MSRNEPEVLRRSCYNCGRLFYSLDARRRHEDEECKIIPPPFDPIEWSTYEDEGRLFFNTKRGAK